MLGRLEQTSLQSTQTTFNRKQNYHLITACRASERAREGKVHGVFTAAVLKGLQSENANREEITSSDLFSFLSRELANSGQEPIQAGMGSRIVLVSYPTLTSTPSAKTVNKTCPYQGLKFFEKSTAKFFFGRERVIQLLIEMLGHSSFVPLIGASGSGKSSVVRAGLIPELEKSGWIILDLIQPGVEPVAKLTATLEHFFREHGQLSTFTRLYSQIDSKGLHPIIDNLPVAGKILLVVDQFEEVFSVCSNEAERHRFIQLLTQLADQQNPHLFVVTTMRADFLEPCLNYRALAQLIQDWKVLALPMNEQELTAAIEEPAKLQGYKLGEGLLDLVLEDVNRESNCLPLLQFVLTELWKPATEQGYKLTVEQYIRMGRVSGCLNRHAEEIFNHLTSSEQEWAKFICLRLVRTGKNQKDTRQRKLKQKLLVLAQDNPDKVKAIDKVIQKFVDRRLFATGEDELGVWIDLSHEALMEGWQKFIDWRQEDRELRHLLDRVDDTLQEWIQHDKDEKFLMMGGLLTQVQKRWAQIEHYSSSSVKEFYQRSNSYEERVLEALAYSQGKKAKMSGESFKKNYESETQALLENLEKRYILQLKVKDEELKLYRKQNASLENIVNTLASRPIGPFIEVESKAVASEKFQENIQQSGTFGIGVNQGEVEAEKIAGTTNEAQSKNLAETAAEIQQLLDKLSEKYPVTTQTEKMAIATRAMDEITTNVTLKQRIFNIQKSRSIEALKNAVNHPVFKIVLAGLQGWLNEE